jgi:AraC family transcriptional regulator, regulatory protein of adaptative response / methylphosphotriester-DNA alkyltransferase methyltransferase
MVKFFFAVSVSQVADVFVIAGARFYREGLVRALEGDPRTRVVGTAASTDDFIPMGTRVPGVVIVDALMNRSLATVREVARSTPAKVVVAGILADGEPVGALASAGARGFVTREESIEDLIAEVVSVAASDPWSPRMAASLFEHILGTDPRPKAKSLPAERSDARLTRRQEQVLDLLAEGLTDDDIAEHLSIRRATVKNHVSTILRELQVDGRQDAGRLQRRPSADRVATARMSTEERYAKLLSQAMALIERDYATGLTVSEVARRIGSSQRGLQRAFHEAGGTSFRRCLTDVRMEHAAELLRDDTEPVQWVAAAVGYRQPAQFVKAFRRHFGCTPTAYRDGAGRSQDGAGG